MINIHWDEIFSLAKSHAAEDPLESSESLGRFLQFWWCNHFSRPLKDPLLESYTLDELCYEYLRYYFARPENDPKKGIEEKRSEEADLDWARDMLKSVVSTGETIQKLKDTVDEAQSKNEEQKPKEEPLPDLPEISTKFDP